MPGSPRNAGGDDGVRREVEQRLRHQAETVGEAVGIDEFAPDGEATLSLGIFRIIGVPGRGTMGVAYYAQRDSEPLVAPTVLAPGLLPPALLALVSSEAEVLSRLDHSGIARLIETGAFDSPAGAQPYFASAFVEGVTLRAWASQSRSPEARLELLAKACDAVQRAHERGALMAASGPRISSCARRERPVWSISASRASPDPTTARPR